MELWWCDVEVYAIHIGQWQDWYSKNVIINLLIIIDMPEKIYPVFYMCIYTSIYVYMYACSLFGHGCVYILVQILISKFHFLCTLNLLRHSLSLFPDLFYTIP